MLQQLAERQVLTLDIACALQQKVHQLQAQNDAKFIQLFQLIEQVYDSSEQKIQHLQARMDKAEKRINIMHWYITSKTKNYAQLAHPALLLTIVQDFYEATDGSWVDEDLLYIELLLHDLHVTQQISYAQLAHEQTRLQQLFQLVPVLPKKEQLYLTEAMCQLYNKQPVMTHKMTPRNLIHELLHTLALIAVLTRPVETQYQVVLHRLNTPDERIHVIRTLHLEAGLSKEESRDATWANTPIVIHTSPSLARAEQLKRALEQDKCSVTIEEIDLI